MDESEDLKTIPQTLREFDELKRIMGEEGLSAKRALILLQNREEDLKLDELSLEARDAFLALAEERWKE